MNSASSPRLDALQSPSCNNCGSSEYSVVFKPGEAQVNQVVRCLRCGLMYAFPLHETNLGTYDVDDPEAELLADDGFQVKHTAEKLPDYHRIAGVLKELMPQQGALFEVGPYSGVLLDFFRSSGWKVSGVEPDGRAVDYARRKFGLDVHRGTLDSVPTPPASADAVVMLHVIEHIDDPAKAVNHVHRILKPGGIFVIETPIYDSLAFKILGRRERSINCDGHIFFYTQTTLSALLQSHGFEILRSQKVGRTTSVARVLWLIGMVSRSPKIQGMLEWLSARFKLDKRQLYLNAHDMVRMYARRK